MNRDVRRAMLVLSSVIVALACTVEAATRWDNPAPQGNVIDGLAWNAGRFVAVGNSGTLLVKDGSGIWQAGTSGTTEWLAAVHWAGNQFVAVGNTGTVLTSPDGSTWTRRSSGVGAFLYGVAYAPQLNRLVAVGSGGTVITSQGGVNWARRNSNAGDAWLNDVAWNGSRFIAVGSDGTIIYSDDGLTWVRSSELQTPGANGVTSGPNLDGIAWDASDSRWIVVAERGAGPGCGDRCIFTSDDNGATWQVQAERTGGLRAVLWDATQGAVAAGNGGRVRSSPDGVTWGAAYNSGFSEVLGVVAAGNGSLVAAGEHGLLLESAAPSGPWTRSGAGTLRTMRAVASPAQGGSYVAVGDGIVLHNPNTSATPATLTPVSSIQGLPVPHMRDVAWGAGGYMAVGDGGAIIRSDTGTTWVRDSYPAGTTPANLYGITRVAAADAWFAVGTNGTVLRNLAGNWTVVHTGDETFNDVAVSDTGVMVVGVSDEGTSGVVLRATVNGSTFTVSGMEHFPGEEWLGIAGNGRGRYVVVGREGSFLTGSAEGGWRRGIIDDRFDLTDVAWDGARYIVVGDGGNKGNRGNTFTSTDGITWERQALSGNRLYGVAAAAATFVAVGEGGTVVQKACPCAANDDARTSRNTPVQIPVLANDIGEQLFIAGFDTRTALGGTVTVTSGVLRYAPPPDFTGTDSFDYTVGSRSESGQDVATVSIIVGSSVSGAAGGGGGGGGSTVLELLALMSLLAVSKWGRRG